MSSAVEILLKGYITVDPVCNVMVRCFKQSRQQSYSDVTKKA